MSRHGSAMARPVYLQQQTYLVTAGTAGSCQQQTSCIAGFDQLKASNRSRRAHAGETREEKSCNPKNRTKQARPPWRVPGDQDK